MKPFFAETFALILLAWPALAQAPDDFAACDSDPWPCLAEAVALVQENGADFEGFQGVLAGYAMRQMDGRNDRWNYWVQIAGVQKEIGDIDAAKATLAPVLAELAAMAGGRTRDDLTVAVIASGALDSDIDAAQTLINDIRNLYSQAEPMNAYIRFLVRAGLPAQALDAAFRFDHPRKRTAVLAVLTRELAAVDEMELARRAADEAMRLAGNAEESSSYLKMLGQAARAMVLVDEGIALGLVDRAFVQVTDDMRPQKFVDLMIDLAEIYRVADKHQQVLMALKYAANTAAEMPDIGMKFSINYDLLPVMVRAGAFGQAFEIVQAETIGDFQALLLMVLADELG